MEPKATNVYTAILIAGIIFFLIVIVFLITIIGYHKKSVAAYLDRLQAELKLSEKEKTRMAYDIHDEVNSKLSGIKMMIDDFSSPGDTTQAFLHRTSESLSSLMLSVRRISNSLIPYSLEKRGLFISLDELIDSLFMESSIQITFDWEIDESDIKEECKIHLYRIIQEMLGNIIKHAHASHIRISFCREGKILILTVTDNGIGFDEKYIRRTPNGIGLQNILARVKAVNGDIYLKTILGKETTWTIKLPVVQQLVR